MFGHGPRDRHSPDEFPHFHHQEQSSMRQDRYQDHPPYLHQFPPQYDSSGFNHYPPAQGTSFWPHDSPPPPPDGPPPAFASPFPSFYPPQHDSPGHYPPGPPPAHYTAYPPHYAHHSSSFGEHMQPQQGHTQPHTYSFEAHGPSSEFSHVSSFGEQNGSRSIDALDSVSHSSSSFPRHTRAIDVSKPLIVQREAVVADDISSPVNVELPSGQLVRVFCKHDKSFNLGVKDNRVIMVEADTQDEFQQWIKDDRYSIRVRDNYGHPAFMLINKGSKKVLKHGLGKFEEVQLINYTFNIQDDDLFWTESQDFGEGFKTVRMANDTLLNLSVACGHNIESGSTLILDTWHKKNTQLWKIFPM